VVHETFKESPSHTLEVVRTFASLVVVVVVVVIIELPGGCHT
jgi:hypothetical protein